MIYSYCATLLAWSSLSTPLQPRVFAEILTETLGVPGQVYSNDARTREQDMSPEERLRFDQLHSGPVVDQLRAWLTAQFAEERVEPNSGLGMAISYLLKHWERPYSLSAPSWSASGQQRM